MTRKQALRQIKELTEKIHSIAGVARPSMSEFEKMDTESLIMIVNNLEGILGIAGKREPEPEIYDEDEEDWDDEDEEDEDDY
jgi:hypothetical protein